MSQPNFPDFLERYQYIAFKWLLFIIAIVVMVEILDKHTHFLTYLKKFASWVAAILKARQL